MARKRETNTIQKSVRISRELAKEIEEQAREERRTFSNMLDVLLYRQLKKELPNAQL